MPSHGNTQTHMATHYLSHTQPFVVYDLYGSPLGTQLRKRENCSTAHQLNCSITRHCLIIAHTCAKDGSSSSAACPAERVLERASSSLSNMATLIRNVFSLVLVKLQRIYFYKMLQRLLCFFLNFPRLVCIGVMEISYLSHWVQPRSLSIFCQQTSCSFLQP